MHKLNNIWISDQHFFNISLGHLVITFNCGAKEVDCGWPYYNLSVACRQSFHKLLVYCCPILCPCSLVSFKLPAVFWQVCLHLWLFCWCAITLFRCKWNLKFIAVEIFIESFNLKLYNVTYVAFPRQILGLSTVGATNHKPQKLDIIYKWSVDCLHHKHKKNYSL